MKFVVRFAINIYIEIVGTAHSVDLYTLTKLWSRYINVEKSVITCLLVSSHFWMCKLLKWIFLSFNPHSQFFSIEYLSVNTVWRDIYTVHTQP